MFKSGQLEKGNSSKIKFKEKLQKYIANKTYSIKYALKHLEEGLDPTKE
jgi:hypothetical protein